MNTVYLGLGGNLGDPIKTVKEAIAIIAKHPFIALESQSKCYKSKPMGPSDQPDYVNAVIKVQTQLAPEALLAACQMLESAKGRLREGEHWGPRLLDIDIVLVEDFSSHTDYLTVPHYGMLERSFVLLPLADVMPRDTILPQGMSLQSALNNISLDDIEEINE